MTKCSAFIWKNDPVKTTRKDKQCSNIGKHKLNGKLYCKTHFKMEGNTNEKS